MQQGQPFCIPRCQPSTFQQVSYFDGRYRVRLIALGFCVPRRENGPGAVFGHRFRPESGDLDIPRRVLRTQSGLIPTLSSGWVVLRSWVLDLAAPHEPHHHQQRRRHRSPANPTTARAPTTPEVSVSASPPSFGFSPFPSNARSASAFESGLVSPQRDLKIPRP